MEHQIIKTLVILTSIKKYILLIVSCFAFLTVTAQIKPKASIKVDKDVYFDETEVDVGSWLSYYTWVLENVGYNSALKVLPDSTAIAPELWSYISNRSPYLLEEVGKYTDKSIGFYKKPFKENKTFGIRTNISEYRKLLDMPITGLTYEQVVDFCKWRTKRFASSKLTFRLPTILEWKIFALKGLSNKEMENGYRDSIAEKKSNCPLFNYNYNNSLNKINTIGSYPSQKSGCFEVFGNISEMTTEKGDARGGNYLLYAKQCHIDSIQHYNKPENWLGFRCIAIKNLTEISISNTKENRNTIQTQDSITLDGKYGLFTDVRDGKIYRTVKIGKQTWMAENLAFKPDKDKYYVFLKEDKYVQFYGYLYPWDTANRICPKGWHLPSKEEYMKLLNNYKDGFSAYNELINSGRSGFSLVFSGFYDSSSGLFIPQEKWSAFWTSTEKNNLQATVITLGGQIGEQPTVSFYDLRGKKNGFAVRCIKDF